MVILVTMMLVVMMLVVMMRRMDGDGVSGGGGGQGVWKGLPGARRYLIGFSTEKSSLGESEL